MFTTAYHADLSRGHVHRQCKRQHILPSVIWRHSAPTLTRLSKIPTLEGGREKRGGGGGLDAHPVGAVEDRRHYDVSAWCIGFVSVLIGGRRCM